MYRSQDTSFLDAVLAGDIQEFIDGVSPDNMTSNGDDKFFEGNVLYKVLPKKDSIINLMIRSRVICKRSKLEEGKYPELVSSQTLLDHVADNIITVAKNCPFKEAIKIISTAQKNLGQNFYGALLVKGKKIINPLHPLVAMMMITDVLEANENYRVLIYVYTNRKEMDDRFRTNFADQKIIEENINSLILSTTHNLISEVMPISTGKMVNDTIEVKYKMRKHKDEIDDEDYYISAQQILTKGIFCPFYGSALIKMNGNTTGLNLSPMGSANIASNNTQRAGTTFDSQYIVSSGQTAKVAFDSVCTGSLSSKTLKGIRSLTHSNLSSPYRKTIEVGSLAYADACVLKSINIYAVAGLINRDDLQEIETKEEKKNIKVEKSIINPKRMSDDDFKNFSELSLKDRSDTYLRMTESKEVHPEDKIKLTIIMENING